MLFKNPTLLYALLFLLVPIIIHLFQLRRFNKVEFSNVAFLKPLISQTRKSQLLKKWLILIMRLLAITALVLAFSQPYFPASDATVAEKQTVIYLDNSYSMQATGSKGQLHDVAIKDLLDHLPPEKEFSLFTNDNTYTNVTKKGISNLLLQSTYSSRTMSYKEIQLKAETLLNRPEMVREFIMISDFQQLNTSETPELFTSFPAKKVRLVPETTQNISVDSVYINPDNNKQLSVTLSSNFNTNRPVTLTLKNKNLLISKTAVIIEEGAGISTFDLPELNEFNGSLTIEDQGLQFDNVMYLSFNRGQKINILAINEVDDLFLKKIFNSDRFNFISTDFAQANYNLIKDQQFIVLNELKNIPISLSNELDSFTQNGGQILVIPSKQAGNYSNVVNNQNMSIIEGTKKITSINYDHPLFKNVFNKRVSNFQYPTVNSSTLPYYANDPVLKYEDGSSFLYKLGSKFIFTAPLNDVNSNIQNSPIIVPVLYNMAMNSLPLPSLYSRLNMGNAIAVPLISDGDAILKLKQKGGKEFIPLQRSYNAYTIINIGDEISSPGNYDVISKNNPVGVLSFNDLRTENQLNYYTPKELGENTFTDVGALFSALSSEEKINSLWKLFLIGTLFFLLCELLILKFVK
jgi:hypothetical protein